MYSEGTTELKFWNLINNNKCLLIKELLEEQAEMMFKTKYILCIIFLTQIVFQITKYKAMGRIGEFIKKCIQETIWGKINRYKWKNSSSCLTNRQIM